LINSLLHIVDDAISDDQKNQVLLVPLRHLEALRHVASHFKYFIEVSWSVQLHLFKRVLVSIKDAIQSITFWVEDVSVQGEAVRSSVLRQTSEFELATEAERWELLVGVVKLEDISHRLESLVVLVLAHALTVKTARICVWITITQGEVNPDGQVDLAASEDVVQETVPLLELALQK